MVTMVAKICTMRMYTYIESIVGRVDCVTEERFERIGRA